MTEEDLLPSEQISAPSQPADEGDTNIMSLFITTFVLAQLCFGGYMLYKDYFSKSFNAALSSLNTTLKKNAGQQ